MKGGSFEYFARLYFVLKRYYDSEDVELVWDKITREK